MQKLTNPLNRELEDRLNRRVAKQQGHDVERERELDLEDLQRRVATFKRRWGEDPEL